MSSRGCINDNKGNTLHRFERLEPFPLNMDHNPPFDVLERFLKEPRLPVDE